MSRTSASFTPGPLVATTTPAQRRKCRAVSKRGRPTCQGNVNDSRYGFHSHWPGSRVGRRVRRVDGKPAPNNLLGLTNVECKSFTCSVSLHVHFPYNLHLLLFLAPHLKKTHDDSGIMCHRLALSCVSGNDNLPRIKRKGHEGDKNRGFSLSKAPPLS